MDIRLTPEDGNLLSTAADRKREQSTAVPSAFFDAMIASLEEPAQPIEELSPAVKKQRETVKR